MARNNKPYLGLKVKYLIFLPNFDQFGISRRIFIKVSNTKIHVNPSSATYADTRRGVGGQSDIEKEQHVEGNRRFWRICDEIFKRLAIRTYGTK